MAHCNLVDCAPQGLPQGLGAVRRRHPALFLTASTAEGWELKEHGILTPAEVEALLDSAGEDL